MSPSRLGTPLLLAIVIFGSAASAAPPSFRETSSPVGWTVVKGQVEAGNLLQSKGGAPLDLQTTNPVATPVEATVRFRAAVGDTITVRALGERPDAMFTAIGQAIRTQCPQAKRLLQWGAPDGSIAHLRLGIGKDVVDGFGMDVPLFELLPEIPI